MLSPLNLRLLNLIIVVINGCPDGRQVRYFTKDASLVRG